jgi:2,3-dihydroxybenzoate decarboxylase
MERMQASRREVLMVAGAAIATASASGPAVAEAKGPVRRIATEEGFTIPEIGAAAARLLASAHDEPGYAATRKAGYLPIDVPDLWQRLGSLGDLRLRHMDEAGIDASLLLIGSPGVQIFDGDEGSRLARLVNDRVAEACRAHPGRFHALAALAPQQPETAAKELERAVTTLGLKGGIINSHTKGEYLDEPKFSPILEAAMALDVPIYIHPREPAPRMIEPFLPPAMLAMATWGFSAETGLHGVRLIAAGVFDRFPRLRIVLGHLGEGIPFFMDRLDVRYSKEIVPARPKLKRKPSDYVKENFVVTSSGMNWAPAIRFCQETLGPQRVLFAADYPFEDPVAAVEGAEATPMTEEHRLLFFQQNAQRVFKL